MTSPATRYVLDERQRLYMHSHRYPKPLEVCVTYTGVTDLGQHIEVTSRLNFDNRLFHRRLFWISEALGAVNADLYCSIRKSMTCTVKRSCLKGVALVVVKKRERPTA